jgi:hypothetical protein
LFEEAEDRRGRIVAGGYRIDHRRWSGDDIPGHKDSLHGRHRGLGVDSEKAALGHSSRDMLGQEVEIGILPDCSQNPVALDDEFASGNRYGASAATRVGLAKGNPQALETCQASIVGQEIRRSGQQAESDSFLGSGVDLLIIRWHLSTVTAIDDLHSFRPEPQRSSCRFDRGRASANHQHLASDRCPIAGVDSAQETQGIFDIRAVFLTLQAQPTSVLSSYGEENGRKSVAKEVIELPVRSYAASGLDLYPSGCQDVDLGIQNLCGEAIVRDAVAQHSSRLGFGLENRYRIAGESEVVGRRDSSGS